MILISSVSVEAIAYEQLPPALINVSSLNLETQKSLLKRIVFIDPNVDGLEVEEIIITHGTEPNSIKTSSLDELVVNEFFGSNYTDYTVTYKCRLDGFGFTKEASLDMLFE